MDFQNKKKEHKINNKLISVLCYNFLCFMYAMKQQQQQQQQQPKIEYTQQPKKKKKY